MVGPVEGALVGAGMGLILSPVVVYVNQFTKVDSINVIPSRMRQAIGSIAIAFLSAASGASGGILLGSFFEVLSK